MASVNPIRYKMLVFIASTVTVTGSIWMTRQHQYFAAEDHALLLADTYRLAVAYQYGTNPVQPQLYQWPGMPRYQQWAGPTGGVDEISKWLDPENEFGGHLVDMRPRWDTLYNQILGILRLTATTDSVDRVWWTDPATLSEDLKLCKAEPRWVLVGETETSPVNRSWESLAPTSGIEQLIGTTSTRTPNAGVRWPYNISDVNLPVASYFYPDAAPKTNLNLWAYDNWWTHVLETTNAYRYWCETEYPPFDILNCDDGAFFAPTNFPLNYTATDYGVPKSFTVYAKSSATNRLYAEVFEVYSTTATRSPEKFVATDGKDLLTALNLDITHQYLLLNEGSSQNIGVRLKSNPGAVVSVPATVSGTGVSIFSALLFGPANWSQYQNVTVTGTSDPDGKNGAAVITLTYQGVETRIAVGVTDDEPDPVDVNLSKPLLVMGKTTAVTYGDSATAWLGSAPSNTVLWTDRRMMATNLYQAADILTNLTQTVKVLPVSAMLYDPEAITNVNYNSSGSLYDPDDFTYDIEEAYNQCMAGRVVTLDHRDWNGVLMESTIGLTETLTLTHLDDVDYRTSNINWVEGTEQLDFLGTCKLPYPSAYALASNYVSRVRVYGVFQCSVHFPAPLVFYPDEDLYPDRVFVSETFDTAGVSWYSSHSVVIDNACGFGDQVFISDHDYLDGHSDGEFAVDVKLELLVDAVNPTVIPEFDLSLSPFEPAISDFTGFSQTVRDPVTVDDYIVYTASELNYKNTVTLKYFVVVVDWNFPSLVPDTMDGFVAPILDPPSTDWKQNWKKWFVGSDGTNTTKQLE